MMELQRAETIANNIIQELTPYCERVLVAGSIRRRRPFVHDIDLVAIPSNQGQFLVMLQSFGTVKLGGQRVIRVAKPEIELDVYIATPATWATLLLIRTGSARHNIYLCSRARSMGMKLHADGSGLFNESADCETTRESRIAGDTEESIFEGLGLPYKRPEERE